MNREEWDKFKYDCEHFSGSFWKGLEYCWHKGWKEELKSVGKKPEAVCRWCSYDWCPLKNG